MNSVMSLFALGLLAFASVCNGAGYVVSTGNQVYDHSYPYQKASLGKKNWYYGSATFYDFTGNSGACGYPWDFVKNVDAAAVPDERWGDFLTRGASNFPGAACGSCYWLKCLNVPRYANTVFCKGSKSILVRIIDYDVPGSAAGGGPWPNNHFDLKPSTFAKLAHKSAGIINVKFKRGYCPRATAKWTLSSASQAFWKDIIVWNVQSSGTIHLVFVKPIDRNKWYRLKRGWGSHYSFLGGATIDYRTKVMCILGEGRGVTFAKYSQAS